MFNKFNAQIESLNIKKEDNYILDETKLKKYEKSIK